MEIIIYKKIQKNKTKIIKKKLNKNFKKTKKKEKKNRLFQLQTGTR